MPILKMTEEEWNGIRVQHVCLVSIGEDYRQTYREFKDMMDRTHGWAFLDCLGKLQRDPMTGGIGHKEDGAFHQTQKAVMTQDGFPGCIEWFIDQIKSGCRRCVGKCHRGCHRIDVRPFAPPPASFTSYLFALPPFPLR